MTEKGIYKQTLLNTTATDHQEPHPHPNPPPEGEGIFWGFFPTWRGVSWGFLTFMEGFPIPPLSRGRSGGGWGIYVAAVILLRQIAFMARCKTDMLSGLIRESPLAPLFPPGQRPYGPAAKEGNKGDFVNCRSSINYWRLIPNPQSLVLFPQNTSLQYFSLAWPAGGLRPPPPVPEPLVEK